VEKGSYTSNSAPGSALAAEPVAGGPGFYSLSYADFTPSEWSDGLVIGNGMIINQTPNNAYYFATVHVPHGVTISKMVVYFLDNADPSLDLELTLFKCSLTISVCESLIYGKTAHASPDFRTNEFQPPVNSVVDLQSYFYLVEVRLPISPLVGLRGIRFDYGYPISLPVIMR
jgi:hypothetical protein